MTNLLIVWSTASFKFAQHTLFKRLQPALRRWWLFTFSQLWYRLFLRRVLLAILYLFEEVVDPGVCGNSDKIKSRLELLRKSRLATARFGQNENSEDLFVSGVDEVVGTALCEVILTGTFLGEQLIERPPDHFEEVL